ncbi:MAG TPA: CbiX/SirB N-terminal domain-containing protein [Mycobacteriales bacterium]|nr:CbiX/SirB N-terminal domain-containing protein [Mycobacteriales bacterium]
MTRAAAPLVLAAHGSANPHYATVITTLASTVAAARPDVDVRIGYLDHGRPRLEDVAAAGSVVVPTLLTNGFHVHIDIPARAAELTTVTTAIGPDPRLALVLLDRLREAGWRGDRPVVVAGAGSADEQALDDVRRTARGLAELTGVRARAAFAGSGAPRLEASDDDAVVPYVIGPGRYATLIAGCGAPIVAAPLGAHPLLAEIIIDRYDSVIDEGFAPRSPHARVLAVRHR